MTANMASLYQELGRLREAVDALSSVYLAREARDGPNDRRTLVVLNNLAHALSAAGRTDDAREVYELSYERHRKALGERDIDTLRAQHNLGALLCRDGVEQECELSREAARVKTEVLGAAHPETLFSRSDLGVNLLRRGRAAEAEPELWAVYEGRLQAMTARHWWTASSKGIWAMARALSADEEGGLADLREAAADLEQFLGPSHERTLALFFNLARACGELGRRDCQRQTLERIVERAEGDRGLDVLRGDQRTRVVRLLTPAYRTLGQLLATEGDLDGAVRTIERSKARGLVAMLGIRSAESVGGLPTDDLQRLSNLDRKAASLADERQRTRDSKRIAELELQQSALAAEVAGLRESLRSQYPRYAAASHVDIPPAHVLARSLATDGIFVGYATFEQGFLAYTVDASGSFAVQYLPVPHVRSLVEAWRSAIGQVGQPATLWRLANGAVRAAETSPELAAVVLSPDSLGEELSALLLEPLRSRLAIHRRWIVSPDGALAALPFETLPWEGQAAASRVEIRYAQSLAVYRLLRERQASARDGLFAMGAPRFASVPRSAKAADQVEQRLNAGKRSEQFVWSTRSREGMGPEWPELPGAAREVRTVAALFSRAIALVGDEASEERLEEANRSGELAAYRYLLFSTHGVLSTASPALSSIVLRQPGSREADDYVTAAEWSAYRLRSELTVLSACDTGLGREVSGEGVMGLPYALFIAGNRNTLMSLWKVPDESTAEFMIRFFRKIRAGVPQSTALAQTRREMALIPRYRHPVHWAGFVLYGA
jgi:CHAT domain-containing protein